MIKISIKNKFLDCNKKVVAVSKLHQMDTEEENVRDMWIYRLQTGSEDSN